MRKIVYILFLLCVFGCSYGPQVNNDEYLSFEYKGYQVNTSFKMSSYVIVDNYDEFIIKGKTRDNHILELKLKKEFDGRIEVEEKIDLNYCELSYYVKRDMNDILDSEIKSNDNINLSYTMNKEKSLCVFEGYLDMKSEEIQNSSLNQYFYVIEDGTRRSDIYTSIYIDVKKV